jgi:hypothetical protein
MLGMAGEEEEHPASSNAVGGQSCQFILSIVVSRAILAFITHIIG